MAGRRRSYSVQEVHEMICIPNGALSDTESISDDKIADPDFVETPEAYESDSSFDKDEPLADIARTDPNQLDVEIHHAHADSDIEAPDDNEPQPGPAPVNRGFLGDRGNPQQLTSTLHSKDLLFSTPPDEIPSPSICNGVEGTPNPNIQLIPPPPGQSRQQLTKGYTGSKTRAISLQNEEKNFLFLQLMDILFRCSLFVLLAFFFTLVPVTVEGHSGVLRRQKREWILAPRNLTEGHDYTTYNSIAKIRSDKESSQKIIYSLTGPGVDKDPKGRFAVDRDTGFVRVFSILDREEIAQYKLFGKAQYLDGSPAEKDIALVINVVDINDCTPVIKAQQVGQVSEHSKPGTTVMKVIATDDDDENTNNALISYSIDTRSNSGGMFAINSQTGEVTVVKTSLDRETKDTYKLTIFASDLGGQPGGNTGTGEIEIKLTDRNDNIPSLLKETYEGSVEENTVGVEVLRIQAADLDLINTENWFAVYEIVSGNEGGYFTITTDKATNEGIIMTTKALNYEEIQTLDLAVKVKNEAEYNFGSSMLITGASESKSYPIKINVINQKEGARFQPSVKVVAISADKTSVSLNKPIVTYAAIDSDTLKTATNIRYEKWGDKDNWLSIDEKTAEIRLNKYPNRESTFLVNGTYYVTIMAISDDIPSKTATGTIAIQVEDFNEHCPRLISTTQTICFGDNVIYVTAEDRDTFPNSAPFDFTIIQSDSKEKWIMEPFNETTVLLRDQGNLWPGTYKVSLNIKDQQGKSCAAPQIMDVTVCTCHETTKSCLLRRTAKAIFGAGGILLMLLGLLLLLCE
ncbi:hypothetical protein CRENBAI_000380 [Crenichthys baileyi]|uniref:Cadherin domain-containing protein n=1 Tax=Crenichthys baileyi TaxID=28760 RepID=A0AAV9S9M8_9TELE